MKEDLQVGDMILLSEGGMALLLERFDPYEEERVRKASACPWTLVDPSRPRYQRFNANAAWRVSFLGETDRESRNIRSYTPKWGWAEINITNRIYGKVISK